jgi:cell shape-determining protein MreD
LVACQILSSLYIFVPVFIGVVFAYMVINFEKEKEKIYIYLGFLYLTMYDLEKGFYLFSSLLFFMIFYYIFVEKIRNSFTCNSCIVAIYVGVAYLGHFILNRFIAYVLNHDGPQFSQMYFYYMLIDALLAIILFKGKI